MASTKDTVRLSAIVAVSKGAKQRATDALTKADRQSQLGGDSSPLKGLSRTHRPINADDLTYPAEETLVQFTVEDLLKDLTGPVGDAMDVVATQENGNTLARADIVVDGRVLVEQAPVGYMLYLSRRLDDIHTLVSRLPVLDPAEVWDWNDQAGQSGAYASRPVENRQTKKLPRNHVKAEATDRHPAQVEVFTEDVTVGIWTTIKFSGAVRGDRKRELINRVEKLQRAVKIAREEANSMQVPQIKVGGKVLDYLFS